MTRNILILTVAYFIAGVLAFTSCGLLFKQERTICDIQFQGINTINKHNAQEPDTITDKFGFEIFGVTSSEVCYLPSVQVFNSANATKFCPELQNHLVDSSFELSLNKPLFFDGDSIAANTNLLTSEKVKSLIDVQNYERCDLVESYITFSETLVEKIVFDSTVYTATFSCNTTDNKYLSKSRTVFFKK